ncbi:helix-turn-helix transcriptional regulator [Terrihabitans sp. PJ23]|uniref:Helix-turn-helix transcriptional regulator n=2 Tax=Terrihabitans rhizophilus TaxID=3092662 RepID=A0ABU4RNR1_9HYPH|nr:helix-turn-helix transcriptional regulator [Terrihabitans sp. PJ23]
MDDRISSLNFSSGGRVALTACQIRMARAALRWSVDELARRSGVSEKTIRRIEQVYGVPNVTLDTMHKLQFCFEQQGMTMIPEDGGAEGPGVRYGRYPGRVLRASPDLDGDSDGERNGTPE